MTHLKNGVDGRDKFDTKNKEKLEMEGDADSLSVQEIEKDKESGNKVR